MQKLFYIEWLKIKSYTIFWVIFGLFAGLLLFALLLFPAIKLNIFLTFPNIWNTVSYIASWGNILFAVLIIVLTGNEFSFRTFRQQVVSGLDRNEIVTGKVLLSVSFALCNTIVVFLLSLIFGIAMSTNFGITEVFKNVYFLPVYFIQSLSYMLFALFITFLLKNQILSVVLYFVYQFLEFILGIYFGLFNLPFKEYLPMTLISNLTPRPGLGMFFTYDQNLIQKAELFSTDYTLLIHSGLALVYSSIFVILSYFLIKRKNL